MKTIQAIICGVLTAACLVAGPVIADNTGETSLETITVTAQKQEENVQEVPISISVFTEQDVEDSSIHSIRDIADFVPNLSIYQNGWANIITPSMRGIHAHGHTLSTATALYIDGVPSLSCLGFEDGILDVERIEVLRGPQGTLYGKNAEAGVISIITRQPDNDFRGKVSIRAGKFLSTETGDGLGGTLGLNLSGPLVKDKFFAGFAGRYQKQEGFIENAVTGETANDKKRGFGRGYLRWTPTDQLDISFTISHMAYDDDGPNYGMTDKGTSAYMLPSNKYRQESSNISAYNESVDSSQALKVIYDINDVLKLTSVTARREYQDKRWTDLDLSQFSISHSKMDSEFKKVSQELRLNYANEKLKWLLGFYYDRDDDDYFNEVVPESSPLASINDRKLDGDSYAAFVNITWPLLRSLNLVSGLRYEQQDRELKDNVYGFKREDSWESVSPKLVLEYFFTPSIMSYIGATKGFRSGGFNVPDVGAEAKSYDQEELWSYEIGFKSAFSENRLIVNGAAYYMDIDDMQVDEAISYLETYTTNAAEASGYGFELDVAARLYKGLSLIAGLGYNHIEFDRFRDTKGDYKGNSPSFAPEYTFNIGAQYRHINGFYARADLIGYGKMYLDNANAYSRGAYEVVNAKIGYETESYDVYLYGKNIFDKRYDLIGYSSGYGVIYNEPGEVGLQLTYKF